MTDVVNGATELANFIPEIWSAKMYPELRKSLVFGSIFNRDYEGDLNNLGDKVHVNQINAPAAEVLTSDKDTYSTSLLESTQIDIVADKRISAAYQFSDLAKLQSMAFEAEAQAALIYSLQLKLEQLLIGILVPIDGTPDHDIAPATPGLMAAADLANARTLLSKADVPMVDRYWIGSPSYYGDLITNTTIASRDYVPAGSPTSTNFLTEPLYGFPIGESNVLANDTSFAVHRSALSLVMQQGIRIQISNLHAQGKYGYVMSADMVVGYKLMDNKRIVKISG